MSLTQSKMELIQKIINARLSKKELQEVIAKAKNIIDNRSVNQIDNQNKGRV
jgi:hypothetical protein